MSKGVIRVMCQEVQWDVEPGESVQAVAGQMVWGKQEEQHVGAGMGETREGWTRREKGQGEEASPILQGGIRQGDRLLHGWNQECVGRLEEVLSREMTLYCTVFFSMCILIYIWQLFDCLFVRLSVTFCVTFWSQFVRHVSQPNQLETSRNFQGKFLGVSRVDL